MKNAYKASIRSSPIRTPSLALTLAKSFYILSLTLAIYVRAGLSFGRRRRPMTKDAEQVSLFSSFNSWRRHLQVSLLFRCDFFGLCVK